MGSETEDGMTNPGTGIGPRIIKGVYRTPKGRCPKCLSKKILGPRVVKDGEEWCNCYRCGHAWRTNRPKVRKGDERGAKGRRRSWNPKVEG